MMYIYARSLVTLCFLIIISGCGSNPQKEEFVLQSGDYLLNVIVATRNQAEAEEIAGHLKQSSATAVHVQICIKPSEIIENIDKTHLVYISGGFCRAQDDVKDIRSALDIVTSRGCIVYLEPNCIFTPLNQLTGLSAVVKTEASYCRPVFYTFPEDFNHIHSLMTMLAEPAQAEFRTQYERKMLPAFVKTDPELSTWPANHKAQAVDCRVLAAADDGNPLMTWRSNGQGGYLWTADFTNKNIEFHGQDMIRNFRLSYPDKEAENFHYGLATADYLFKDLLLDLASKRSYGFSIRRVWGPNGGPCLSWQNHLDGFDNWQKAFSVRWTSILEEVKLIPSFTVRKDILEFAKHAFIKNDRSLAEQIINGLSRIGIQFNPHLVFLPNDSAAVETEKINSHELLLAGLGAAPATGVDHHVFYTHAKPVWQSFRSEFNRGLIYDFGGATISNFNLFPYFFCTSSAYRPYCAPFLLEDDTGETLPFVVWSPLPARPVSGYAGQSGYAAFPVSLRLPFTLYFHPEFIEDAKHFRDLPGWIREIITELTAARDREGYCPVTETQAARSFLAAKYTRYSINQTADQINIIPDYSQVPPVADAYKKAIGLRLEPSGKWMNSARLQINSEVVYRHPVDGIIEFSLNPRDSTRIVINPIDQTDKQSFQLERINVPFKLTKQTGSYRLVTDEPGLRWLRYRYNSGELCGWLPVREDLFFHRWGSYIEVVHYGSELLEIEFRYFVGENFIRKSRRLLASPPEYNSRLFRNNKIPGMPGRETDIKPVSFIDFGTPEARDSYGRGWCVIDEHTEDRTLTWSSGYLCSTLTIPLKSVDVSCQLVVRPFLDTSKGTQTLTISLNGFGVRTCELQAGWQTVKFDLSADQVNEGLNLLCFDYEYMTAPVEIIKDSEDYRLLAVAFDTLLLK